MERLDSVLTVFLVVQDTAGTDGGSEHPRFRDHDARRENALRDVAGLCRLRLYVCAASAGAHAIHTMSFSRCSAARANRDYRDPPDTQRNENENNDVS